MSEKTTNNKEKKFKFNWIDVLVVIVFIVAIFVGVTILNRKPIIQPEVEKRVATAVVEIQGAEKALLDQIQVGDEVFLTVDNIDQVKVVAIDGPKPTEVLILDQETATFNYLSSENTRYTSLITIEAEVEEDDANIYAGSTSLKVGKGVFIKGKGYSARGFILELETSEKGE